MRFAAAIFLAMCTMGAWGQKNIWEGVSPKYNPPTLDPAHLSNPQMQAIATLLRKTGSTRGWDCGGDQLADLIAGLQIWGFPAGAEENLVLVEAGEGCARGAQGSNGAMWLMHLEGDNATILASPKDDFSGWIFSVRERSPYPDVILGSHTSDEESSLTYFRFDGKTYHSVGQATLQGDGEDNKIVPRNEP